MCLKDSGPRVITWKRATLRQLTGRRQRINGLVMWCQFFGDIEPDDAFNYEAHFFTQDLQEDSCSFFQRRDWRESELIHILSFPLTNSLDWWFGGYGVASHFEILPKPPIQTGITYLFQRLLWRKANRQTESSQEMVPFQLS